MSNPPTKQSTDQARAVVLAMHYHPDDCAKGWEYVKSKVVMFDQHDKDVLLIASALDAAREDERRKMRNFIAEWEPPTGASDMTVGQALAYGQMLIFLTNGGAKQ